MNQLGFTFADFFKELCALAPSSFDGDSLVVVHFIGDPLDREYFVKDVKCMNREVLIRVGNL